MKNRTHIYCAFIAILGITQMNAQTWSTVGGELNSHIDALYVFDDELYLGGNFTNIDGDAAYGLAVWGGSSYTDRNTTLVDGIGVNGFGVYQGKLMAVGAFFHGFYGPGFVAEWDGTDFVGEQYRLNSNVYDILTVGDEFYVVGNFDEFEGTIYRHVAKFNGSNYETVGEGFDLPISDLIYYNGYVTAGGGNGDNLTYFNGANWADIGTNGPAGANLAIFQDELYAIGCFDDAVDGTAKYIAKWDGTAWSDVGGGLDGGYNCARAILATSSYLYVAGQFTSAGGVAVNNIARWDGTTWSAMGDGIPDQIINCLAIYEDHLYAGPTAQDFSNYLWKYSEEVTGIEDQTVVQQYELNVFPNPATQQITFECEQELINNTLQISDLAGRIILELQIVQNNTTVPVTNMANGIYVAKVVGDNTITAEQIFVVNK